MTTQSRVHALFYSLSLLLATSTIFIQRVWASDTEQKIEKRTQIIGDNNAKEGLNFTNISVEKETEKDIYKVLNVRYPSGSPMVRFKRWSWKLHGHLLPILHGLHHCCALVTGGPPPPADVYVNLRVLWNKALASIDVQSPAYEGPHFWTYRMLPIYSRWILNFVPFFPRWYHANIELRTVYLNRAIKNEIQWIHSDKNGSRNRTCGKFKIRVVILGGGYDTRSVRVLTDSTYYQSNVDKVYELDLPHVMKSKATLLLKSASSAKELLQNKSIELIGVDLNDIQHVRTVLSNTNTKQVKDCQDTDNWYTIVVSEAFLMYLDSGRSEKLLQICGETFGKYSSFVFVDRFEGIKENTETEAGRRWLLNLGWDLTEWRAKPGATRHMGIARCVGWNE
mmetsp:Transcript_18556/g.28052  ORF Transcript_18556/g.28052 Transcript_18556/m.28052 type:complete len:394 (+) Transcript_18556:231-1412(+)|eukprot:CAMPEP_0178925472 /NCGR_PEP_ID=MMETSP0786-20121207/17934_1 /TAXON_ID=186022 /ORGANISM="Thalassionema frauenfeldii, Strain CCMP 1798" /LENGTH=393 /DNA_ID=CAMNT_0020600363 /DNA_START=154 /DNA_END=1335 /DNA_ORIENTATION=-